ncbi:MAG: hypothetical protein ACRDK8_14235, partial [Solirubrobacteraceae bacterium]
MPYTQRRAESMTAIPSEQPVSTSASAVTPSAAAFASAVNPAWTPRSAAGASSLERDPRPRVGTVPGMASETSLPTLPVIGTDRSEPERRQRL